MNSRHDDFAWRGQLADRHATRLEAAMKLRPQAVRRAPMASRADWAGLAATCALWAAGVAVAIAIVYTIATIPSGWWIAGGLPWTH